MNYSVLRGKMAEAGYTQGRLAQEIGIAPQSLSRKLKGKRQFTVGEAAHFAKYALLHQALSAGSVLSLFFYPIIPKYATISKGGTPHV